LESEAVAQGAHGLLAAQRAIGSDERLGAHTQGTCFATGSASGQWRLAHLDGIAFAHSPVCELATHHQVEVGRLLAFTVEARIARQDAPTAIPYQLDEDVRVERTQVGVRAQGGKCEGLLVL
jgi:hypothetical protein